MHLMADEVYFINDINTVKGSAVTLVNEMNNPFSCLYTGHNNLLPSILNYYDKPFIFVGFSFCANNDFVYGTRNAYKIRMKSRNKILLSRDDLNTMGSCQYLI